MRCNARRLPLPRGSHPINHLPDPGQDLILCVVSALKACSALKDLRLASHIHASEIAADEAIRDLNVANTLIHMYAKCGSVSAARSAFETIPHRSIVSWNAAMFGFADNGAAELTLEFFQRMHDEGYVPNHLSYIAALKACALRAEVEVDGEGGECLVRGREIHRQAERRLGSLDLTLGNTLVHMYQKCGSLLEARELFDRMAVRDEVTFNALIFGYVEVGDGDEALRLFSRMVDEFRIEPNEQTYIGALKACGVAAGSEGGSVEKYLAKGIELHFEVVKSGHESDMKVASTLVDMYVKCGSLENASRVFNGMKNRDIVPWNSIIMGYAQSEQGEIALKLFSRMQEEGMTPNSRTVIATLQACGEVAGRDELRRSWCLEKGREIHNQLVSSGLGCDNFVANKLMNMYGKCGSLAEACRVFGRMPAHDLVTFNVMIFNYAEGGEGETALELFGEVQERGVTPNCQTYIAALKACINCAGKEEGVKQTDGKLVKPACLGIGSAIHDEVVRCGFEADLKVASTLVDFYAKCGCMDKASEVFRGMKQRDVVSWNAVITGYAQSDEGELGLHMFARMLEDGVAPDGLSFVAALKACSSAAGKEEFEGRQADGSMLKLRSLKIGAELHREVARSGFESDAKVGNTLLDMYSKCGSMSEAGSLFERIVGDTVSWNTMILGYAINGEAEVALRYFASLLEEGLTPNEVTLVAALKACSSLGSLSSGRMIHQEFVDAGLVQDPVTIGNSLIAFYGRCGSMSDAQQVFNSIEKKQLVTWNALVAGYSHQGDTEEVFRLLDAMQNVARFQPDSVTFLSVLHACSHAGLVEQGRSYFQLVQSPRMEHYSCMVDLLGRANRLDEALQLLQSMKCKARFSIWRTLLAAARKWKNLKVGRTAFQELLKLEQRDGAAYVLMANMYAAAGMWEDCNRVHEQSKICGAWRRPGESWWSDQSGRMHRFTAGDYGEHPQRNEIETLLSSLMKRMKVAGYVPDLSTVLHDLSDDEKESALCGHSERLAIGCALLNSASGSTIRIVKSLRICDDCHTAISFISKIEDRAVVCRDACRFHVFKDGKCSCGDFW